MKTLSALFLFPALTNGLLLMAGMAVENRSLPAFNFWPKRFNRTGPKVGRPMQPQPVETLSYHSLMINGARHYTAKNYALALANYRRALAVRPDDVTALSGEAWSLYYLGQEEQAAKDFRALLKFDANDSWAREGMALCQSASTTVCA